MADVKHLRLLATALATCTVLCGLSAAHAADLKLFAPVGEAAAPAKALPLLQPLPGEERRGVSGRTALVPFEQAASRMRFDGEDDTTVLTFNLTGDQRAAGGQLQLSYKNAVSLLPEDATLDVEINGRAAGTFAVRSPNGLTLESLPVAADLLRDGRNEARLRVRGHHRVDCSLSATYELWAELDPVASGFATVRNDGFRKLADLLAVGRTDNGMTDIRLVLPDAGAMTVANDALPLIQSLALYLNRSDINVSVGSEPGEGPGIDVFVGGPENYRNVQDAATIMAAAGSGMTVTDGKADGRAAVILAGAGSADLNTKLINAVRGPMRDSFDTGVRGKTHGRLIAEPGATYTLKDVGYRTQPFAGRLQRVHFDLEMPADFYPAEYATIDFYLKGATAPGLEPGAQLLVRVNGKSARSYPFRDVRGEEFNGKRLELPLRAFHPGVNQVEILAELPVAADASCAPESRDDSRPRFMMLEESEIRVPQLARIGRLPDLAAFAGNAYPFAGGDAFDVFVDNADPRSLGAAYTVLSRLSLSARQPLPGEIVFSAPQEGRDRNALIFSSGRVMAALQTSKGNRVNEMTLASRVDPLTTASVGEALTSAVGADADPRKLLDAFHSSTAMDQQEMPLMSRAREWFGKAAGRFGMWLQYKDTRKSDDLAAGTLVTIGQSRAPLGSSTWTVIKAANPDDLAKGVAKLTETSTWTALDGGTASIGAARLNLVTEAPAKRYVNDLPDTGLFNLRRIIAAWFSDNFQFYIVSVIAMMAAFALWLGRIVPRSGVRTDQ